MAYETLFNASPAKQSTAAANKKPNYTPTKSLKKVIKFVHRLLKNSSSSKHQKFLNDLDATLPQLDLSVAECQDDSVYASDEEYENYMNECREAAVH